MPIMLAPFFERTPTTLNETLGPRGHFADGRLVLEQLVHERLPDQANLAGVAHVAVGEAFALGQVRPVAHLQERRRGAVHLIGTQFRFP